MNHEVEDFLFAKSEFNFWPISNFGKVQFAGYQGTKIKASNAIFWNSFSLSFFRNNNKVCNKHTNVKAKSAQNHPTNEIINKLQAK